MGSGGVPRRPGADRRAGSRSWCGRARGGSLGLGHGVLRRHTAPRSGLAPAAQLPKSGCAGCGTLGARSEGRRGSPVRDARGGQCGTPGASAGAAGRSYRRSPAVVARVEEGGPAWGVGRPPVGAEVGGGAARRGAARRRGGQRRGGRAAR